MASSATAEGSTITKVQRELNSLNSFTGKAINSAKDVTPTWTSNDVGGSTQSLFARTNALDAEAGDVRTTLGTAVSATNLGTFTGVTIADNTDVKSALQSLETAVEAVSSGSLLPYASKTTTYTASTSDYVISMSSSSWTLTLPTAVGNTGKVFELIHAGTSLTQVYTLNTTSAQTIGGIASGSYALYTNGERLKVVSDGTNWIILSHGTVTKPSSYTPTTAGLGTIAGAEAYWHRVGSHMHVRGQFTCGTTTAAVPTISLPNSMAIDFAVLPQNLTVKLGDWFGNINTTVQALPINSGGPFAVTYNSGTSTTAVVLSNRLDLDDAAAGAHYRMDNANVMTVGLDGDDLNFTFSVPISGWQP